MVVPKTTKAVLQVTVLIISFILFAISAASPVHAYQCNFEIRDTNGNVIENPYAGTPYTVVITGAYNETNTSLLTSADSPAIYADDVLWATFSNFENGGGSATVSPTTGLPGQGLELQLKIGDSEAEVCWHQITLGADPNKAPDGEGTGCCSDDGQCSSWFGSESTCSRGNGYCQSGFQCDGGTVIPIGQTCDLGASSGVCATGSECIQTSDGYMCATPCAQGDVACLHSRYPENNGLPPQCDNSGVVISQHEERFGDNLYCDTNTDCWERIWRNPSGQTAVVCYSRSINDCGSNNECSLGATMSGNQISVNIDVTCLREGVTYDVLFTQDQNATQSQSFTIGTGDDRSPRSITFNNVQLLTSGAAFLYSRTPYISVQPSDGGDGGGCSAGFPEWLEDPEIPVVEPDDPAATPVDNDPGTSIETLLDQSEDYGIKNCPSVTNGVEDWYNCILCVSGVQNASDVSIALQNYQDSGQFYVPGQGGTWTALGCITTSPEGVFAFLVRLALGILGGVVLLRFIYLGYMYQTGDEGKIKEARSGIISTIGAVLVVVFSVVILQFIGVNILDVVPVGFFGAA